MKEQLKTILLNQYIGAIAIGYLVGRGIEAVVGGFMPGINAALTTILTGGSAGKDYWTGVVRGSLLSNLILSAFYFGISFLFASWLYSIPPSDSENNLAPGETDSIC